MAISGQEQHSPQGGVERIAELPHFTSCVLAGKGGQGGYADPRSDHHQRNGHDREGELQRRERTSGHAGGEDASDNRIDLQGGNADQARTHQQDHLTHRTII